MIQVFSDYIECLLTEEDTKVQLSDDKKLAFLDALKGDGPFQIYI